ncbi:MAG: hypothetical protein K1Y02_15920 [Candidatus Hydrogenedentes bacterium]|nr:hypothetical protein [Candidatus Hydrogenedentota bacterium]
MRRLPILLILAIAVLSPIALAQEYLFSVPSAEVTVNIETDGSARIYYKLTFECAQGAHPIDVVDIGMPNLAPHTPGWARIDGKDLDVSNIRISEYLKPRGCGYEIHLAPWVIAPGRSGVLEFEARETQMVWQDITDPDLASFRFTPTWFGSEYVQGMTSLTLRVILPIPEADYPAVKDQIKWHREGEDFSLKGVMEGEQFVSVAWVRDVWFTIPNEVGLSFPKKYITNIRKDSLFGLMARWLDAHPNVAIGSGIGLAVCFSIAFFMITRGTGISLWFFVVAAMAAGMSQSSKFHLCLYPFVALFCLLIWLLFRRKRKRYFPAVLCREGGGIKRGFTAVEAAVLLEAPLNKVLTMIVFGLVKKGIVHVVSEDPLSLDVVGKESSTTTWELPDKTKVKIWPYEPAFIKAFAKGEKKPIDQLKLDDPFDALIERVSKSMKGFDLDATREYYQQIVSRAWQQVKAEASYESRYEKVDEHLGWLMIDKDWERPFRDWDHERPYRPTWWYGRTHIPSQPFSGGGMNIPTPTTAPGASFGDVASAITGRFENVSTKLVGSLDAFSKAPGPSVDLSGIDRFTGEVLKAMASSGGGRGGGGGCACAGCACACACAGGGR